MSTIFSHTIKNYIKRNISPILFHCSLLFCLFCSALSFELINKQTWVVVRISIKVVVVVKKLTRVFSEVFYTALPEDNMATHLSNMATHLNNMATLHRGIHRNRDTLHRVIHRSRVDILHKGTRHLGIRRSRATLHKGTRPPLTAVILEEALVWGDY